MRRERGSMLGRAPRIALLAGLLSAGTPATAQTDDWTACAKSAGDGAIESGGHTGRALAVLYSNRGAEWAAKGDMARALADYDAAINHDASLAAAFHNRGMTRASQRDFDGALADYDQAISLNP